MDSLNNQQLMSRSLRSTEGGPRIPPRVPSNFYSKDFSGSGRRFLLQSPQAIVERPRRLQQKPPPRTRMTFFSRALVRRSVSRLCQSGVREWCARAMFFGRAWASGKVSGKVLWRDFGASGKVSGRGSGKVCGTLGHANSYLLLLFG